MLLSLLYCLLQVDMLSSLQIKCDVGEQGGRATILMSWTVKLVSKEQIYLVRRFQNSSDDKVIVSCESSGNCTGVSRLFGSTNISENSNNGTQYVSVTFQNISLQHEGQWAIGKTSSPLNQSSCFFHVIRIFWTTEEIVFGSVPSLKHGQDVIIIFKAASTLLGNFTRR